MESKEVRIDKEFKDYKINRETAQVGVPRTDASFLNELDEEQKSAVVEPGGKIVVIAGPGSGKTRVITYKIAHLLITGIKPSEILLVTFTRAAAREMIERAQRVTKTDLNDMLAGTFHHVCNTLLRKYGNAVDLKPNFTILDEGDAKSLMKFVRSRFVTSKQMNKALPTNNELYSLYSYMNNTLSTPYEVVLKRAKRWINVIDVIERIFQEYTLEKGKQNVVDYDDLLIKMLQLLENNEHIREAISSKFRWILVDEFQDTNIVQLKIVQLLSQVHGNIFVVADDSQSIYFFRGARFENVREIMNNAKTFKIQTNYRSTDKIVDLVNSVIPRSSVPKRLRSVRPGSQKPIVVNTYDHFDEASFVAQQIISHVDEGANYSDIAVIYRAHSHSLELQLELAKRSIPFRILSGIRFTESAHAKDVIAFLKLMVNPFETISWMRILKLSENVGDATAEKIANQILSQESPIDAFLAMGIKSANIVEIKEIMDYCRGKLPSEQIERFYEGFYKNYLEVEYVDFRDREEDIERLIEMAKFYDSTQDFLNELLISEDVGRQTEDEGKVTLTTVHQAKGLEWKVVFVIGVNPGDFPHFLAVKDGTLDEEERLFYVAITRAKDYLYISHSVLSRSNYRGFKDVDRDFIEDIPPQLVEFWRVR
ncbi:MAG TPA: ATP-dependent helicase [Fervidobacterium sp.]|nr:ATP-dependent helicase [Fervidobacterium sp.]HPT54316.1 ATP-dependent helicase [Fervidobacterium sp.]HPZ17781.1 ATP-dependent helicase [Fervidobacterium sp.]HQE48923.1 ATP-dependent helicase [Fervidobacterium sp.]HUM42735.1 ATP-dependent helicase [Fervidobacterium sp.]